MTALFNSPVLFNTATDALPSEKFTPAPSGTQWPPTVWLMLCWVVPLIPETVTCAFVLWLPPLGNHIATSYLPAAGRAALNVAVASGRNGSLVVLAYWKKLPYLSPMAE